MSSLIQGIGTDIIEVERIKKALLRHGKLFAEKLFTHKEINYCHLYENASLHFAGRFAAKEAILKALGTGLQRALMWKEIEIINNKQGKPEVHLSGKLREEFPLAHFFLSISHCEAYATATAILIGEVSR